MKQFCAGQIRILSLRLLLGMAATATPFAHASAPKDAQRPIQGPALPGPAAQNDPLQSLLAEAAATHPSIASARANVRASGADLRAAQWQRFPSVSVEGMLLSERGNSRQASLMVEQPLWTAGRISGSVRQARANQQAALAAYQEAVLQVMLDVAHNWTEYHRLDRRHTVLKRSLGEHRTLVETMKRRIAQEISPLSDLELAQSRTSQIEQQVTSTGAQRTAALQRLRELVGDPGLSLPPSATVATTPLLDEEGALLAQALAFDPARKRFIAESEAARAQASVAQASTLPQLNGQYSFNETYGHRVGLVLRAQSDGGFSRFAAASAARERQEAAALKIDAQEREVRETIISDLADYDAARQRIESTRTAQGATARVTESYMRQFVSGRRSWLDVMNAVREGTTAENDAIDAEASAISALQRLLMRSGGWAFPHEAGDLP